MSDTANKRMATITTDDQTNAAARRAGGEFVRGVSTARNWIDLPGTSSADSKFPPDLSGRYHLIVAFNCPWCHRVLLARAMLGLQDVITVDVLYPNRSTEDEPRGANLWKFEPEGTVTLNGRKTTFPECTADTVLRKKYAKEIYEDSGIDDQKSVPILFDKKSKVVVNNESAEIVRMFITSLYPAMVAEQGDKIERKLDMYPDALAQEIDEWNDYIYVNIANGAYKAGFSSNQDVYETAYRNYFDALIKIDNHLGEKQEKQLDKSASTFLVGDSVTEADLRLFPTLYRHDPVYYSRFKLCEKFLHQYPNIWRWMTSMVSLPGMEPVSNAGYLAHCKQGYFGRSGSNTIPVGPLGYPECYFTGRKPWE